MLQGGNAYPQVATIPGVHAVHAPVWYPLEIEPESDAVMAVSRMLHKPDDHQKRRITKLINALAVL